MQKLLIWVSGNKFEASRRYRIDCYYSDFRKHYNVIYFDNISISNAIITGNIFYICFQLLSVKCIFLQRRLLPLWLIKLLKFFNKKIIFDVDDAIQTYIIYKKYNFKKFASLVDLILVGNQSLHNFWYFFNKNTKIVETGVKYSGYKARKLESDKINLLWIGTSSNFSNLDVFIEIFKNSNLQNVYLTVISDKCPTNITDVQHKVNFEYWSVNTDKNIAESNIPYIGLMPLDRNDYQSFFKCSFKMLQYMNWSMPVIVTAYGMNEDLLKRYEVGYELSNNNYFENCINQIMNNQMLYDKFSKNGNKVIFDNFSHEIIINKYLNYIHYELSNL